MVFYSIRVGSFIIKYSPFKEKEQSYEPCDKDGNILKRISGTLNRGCFINESTGERYDKAFMLVNGKPYDKFARTKETDKYREVEQKEVFDLLNPKMYFAECEGLFRELSASGKALKFGISFGGQKFYMAYVFINPLYNCLMMWIGTTRISEQMLEIIARQHGEKKLESISLVVQGIDKARVEDLITL